MDTKTGSSYTTGTTTDSVLIPTASLGFSMMSTSKEDYQMIATTIDYKKLHYWRAKRLYCHFRLPAIVAITWRHFIWPCQSKIPDLLLEVRRYLLLFRWYNYFRFWWPYRYFRWSLLKLSASSPWSKTPGLPSEL